MNPADNSVPIRRIRGKREMKELALAAVTALVDADLVDQVDALQDRLFSRGAGLLFDTTQVGVDEWLWSFKPMVELLLEEVRQAAGVASLTLDERRDRIRWALEMAGF